MLKKIRKNFFSILMMKNLLKIIIVLSVLLLSADSWAKGPKVAVLPWKVNSAEDLDFVKGAMVDMLSTRLGAGGALEVVRPEAAKAAVPEKTELTDTLAQDAGKKLKADYVLYGSLTVFGNAISLDAKLVNIKDGSATPFYGKGMGMDSVVGLTDRLSMDVMAALGAPSAPAAPKPEVNPVPLPTPQPPAATAPPVVPPTPKNDFIIKKDAEKTQDVWKSGRMEGLYTGLAAADLDKDGSKELFIISRNAIVVGRPSAEGLKIIKEIKQPGIDNVAITAIDTDKDGVTEVYVSRVSENKPASALIEFKDNDYKVTITGIKWLLRTAQMDFKGSVLVGQGFRRADGFHGPLKVLKKEGNKIAEKGDFEVTLPRKVDIYRFDSFALTGKGDVALVTLDDRNYLSTFKKTKSGKWENDWKSKDYFGGTLNLIEFSEDRPGVAPPEPLAIEGRFFHTDVNADGVPELIIKKNVPGGLGRWANRPVSFSGGEVLSLTWDGERFQENWRTKQVEGYMADFLIDDLDGDGAPEITMLIVDGTEKMFGTQKSYILSHKVSI